MSNDFNALGKCVPLKECPVCKKKFVPAPEHAWKIKYDTLVCSYTCMRAVEKGAKAKKEVRL